MPQAYSKKDLHRTYDEIALERPHRCDECGTSQFISHSHLIPRGLYPKLATVKENVQYHCMTVGDHKGCHDKWDSMEVVNMKNFEKYYRLMYTLEKEATGKTRFFWSKMYKLSEHWLHKDFTVYQRVMALFAEIDRLEHPRKTL